MRAFVHQCPDVCIAETLAGEPGIVDLWYCFDEEIDDTELLAAPEAFMTPDECERHRRLRFARDRRLFLATRALVRTVLSSYAAVAPADWRFAADQHGRPCVVHPPLARPIHFNLANTRGLVVCVVSVAHEPIGVDAERIDRQVKTVGLAERYFAASEVRALRALRTSEQTRRFFAYWTLKESYTKARGLGLALPLDQFSFLVGDNAVSIGFDARMCDVAARWRFALLDAPPRHIIAVGVDTEGAALSLRAAHVTQLPRRAAPIPRSACA